MPDSPIDKDAVQKSFDKAAFAYDRHAGLQQKTACDLLALCGKFVTTPQAALDVGTGTGYGVRLLCRRYPAIKMVGLDISPKMLQRSILHGQHNATTHFVCGDAERLPFADGVFDLVYSSSSIQWCTDKERLFGQLHAVLRDGGWLFFSTFGPQTLFELRESWRTVDDASHTLEFDGAASLKEMLGRSGFTVRFRKRVMEVIHHEGVQEALRSLKNIGAQHYASGRRDSLTPPGKLRAMSEAYRRRFGVQGLVPMTYETLLFAAHKGD